MAAAETTRFVNVEEWRTANARYLASELARLRLVIRRRARWLRTRWDLAAGPPTTLAITDAEAEFLMAGEDAAEERAFYEDDEGACRISAAIAEAEEAIRTLRQDMDDCGAAAPLDMLAARFDLTLFERDVLLLAVAPELEPGFGRLYGYIQDDASRLFATPQLAWSLFGAEPGSPERLALGSSAPLRRWRLLNLEPGLGGSIAGAALRADERILNYLTGMNQMDPRCAGVLARVAATPAPASMEAEAAKLAECVSRADGTAVINLVGPPDSGRAALAQAACGLVGIGLLALDPRLLPQSAPDRRELLGYVEREAALLGSAILVDHDHVTESGGAMLLAELRTLAAPMWIVSREQIAWDGPLAAVQVTRPDAAEQAGLWRQVTGGEAADFGLLVEQFDLGPAGIARAAAIARNRAALRAPGEPNVSVEDLWQACRQQAGPRMEQLARRIEPRFGWDDIVLPAEVLARIREIAVQVAHRHQVYQAWGFARKMSRGRGISALFSGASGVGKTMAAEVLARHLSLDLHRIDLAGVVSKYIGETEKNLRAVFEAAESSGAILFFDEADALFGKRSEVKDSHDRYANIEINYLLQRMEDYRGLAILATNMRGTLDAAFLRRLRFLVDFPFPDAARRIEIWRRVFPPDAPLHGIDYPALSRLEIAGGAIRNIAVNAAFHAAAAGTPITMDHVMQAARTEYTKMDRLVLDSEFGRFGAGRPQ